MYLSLEGMPCFLCLFYTPCICTIYDHDFAMYISLKKKKNLLN